MAYDEELAALFRDALAELPAITEKRMMGGVCFFQHGNMVGGCDLSKDGERRFMFRVGKENENKALSKDGVTPVEFAGGRRMGGMVFVGAADCKSNQLQFFLKLAINFVSTLPHKD